MYNNHNQNFILSKDFSTSEVINQKSTSTPQDSEQENVGKVALMPVFIKTPAIEYPDNLEQAGKIIKMIAERVYQEMLASPRGKKLLAKAFRYHIPYDKENIDWLLLIAQIKEYESLLNHLVGGYSLILNTKGYGSTH